MGDQSNYYLSTASNSLGVVVAHSGMLSSYFFRTFFFLGGGVLVPGGGANVGWWETVSDAGDPLHPINWRQMACARTGVVEERKVAKPI